MDWGHSALGVLLGSEYQVIYFFAVLSMSILLAVHLFSIPETPLGRDEGSDPDAEAGPLLPRCHTDAPGYGTTPMETSWSHEVRSRSYTALRESNGVTPTAKQPSKEVSDGGHFTSIQGQWEIRGANKCGGCHSCIPHAR